MVVVIQVGNIEGCQESRPIMGSLEKYLEVNYWPRSMSKEWAERR